MDDSVRDELDAGELPGWAEFSCWTALILTPLIWWLQGPSVSKDQFIVRTALVSLAGAGALVLRLTALIRRIRRRRQESSSGFDRTGTPAGDSPAGERQA